MFLGVDILILVALAAVLLLLLSILPVVLFVAMRACRPVLPPLNRLDDQQVILTPYHLTANARAAEDGYVFCGTYDHTSPGQETNFITSVWLSPDGATVVFVADGKGFRMRLEQTMFRCLTTDAKCIVTTDYSLHSTLSGVGLGAVLPGASWEELAVAHKEAMTQLDDELVTFTPADAHTIDWRVAKATVDDLERKGHITFTDASRTEYRYTVLAALRIALRDTIQTVWWK